MEVAVLATCSPSVSFAPVSNLLNRQILDSTKAGHPIVPIPEGAPRSRSQPRGRLLPMEQVEQVEGPLVRHLGALFHFETHPGQRFGSPPTKPGKTATSTSMEARIRQWLRPELMRFFYYATQLEPARPDLRQAGTV
ncbi:hypothetical protein KM043_017999 [Ampulex compressa]|nr:hypothetical protein KM043_017999 [Ampulex compressa]